MFFVVIFLAGEAMPFGRLGPAYSYRYAAWGEPVSDYTYYGLYF